MVGRARGQLLKGRGRLQWAFLEDEDAARAASTSRKPYIPVNQVFDILPIRSKLGAGDSEDVEFIYYGHASRRFKGTVLCEVEGGPEYELTLLGEASTIGFRLDRALIDFGKVLHTKREDKEFAIVNMGKVAFPFRVRLDGVSRPNMIEVYPAHGRVFANDKQRIVVRFKPGLPEKVHEKLVIEVAHFDPIEFEVYGEGIYAQVAISPPREETKMIVIICLPGDLEMEYVSCVIRGQFRSHLLIDRSRFQM